MNTMYNLFLTGAAVGALLGVLVKWFLNRENQQKQIPAIQETVVDINIEDVHLLALIVNGELKMSAGKVMAQCSHAALGIHEKHVSRKTETFTRWTEQGHIIRIFKVNDSLSLFELKNSAEAQNFSTYFVQDAGRTQIAAGSRTVLAIGPDRSSKILNLVGHLPLY